MLDDEAEAMLRLEDGIRISPSSGYMPGDPLPWYMYGADSAYRGPLESKPIVVAYSWDGREKGLYESGERPRSIGADE